MIVPLVNQILKIGLIGTTAVLTKTNEEALQITGLLLKNNFPAKLVQSNDIFNLFDLVELRSFYNEISDGDNPRISKDIWTNAKNNYYNKYKNSSSFELCKALIKDFQIINPKAKYKSDFELFIRESRLEDFAYHKGETISVSTIHKAKGKEFDNVFLLLNDINIEKDSTKRQLYVAMTRAKNCLYIHYNNAIFRDLDLRSVTTSKDTATYNKPQQLIYHLSHRDVQLSYFEYVQHRINKLVGGSVLFISKEGLTNTEGELIVRFSRKYKEDIASMTKSGYKIITAKVNYILYWNYNDEKTVQTKEIKIVLPALEYG